MWIGDEAYLYDANHFLITSLDLPANSEVVTASPEKPCLGLVLNLDLRTMAELISQGDLPLPGGAIRRPGHRHRHGHAAHHRAVQASAGFARRA